MERFCVCEITPNFVTLRDGNGGHHRARITSALPTLGSQLWGDPPALGFSILLGCDGGEVYRAIFEEVLLATSDAESPSVPVRS
jgi:hypothetical protein